MEKLHGDGFRGLQEYIPVVPITNTYQEADWSDLVVLQIKSRETMQLDMETGEGMIPYFSYLPIIIKEIIENPDDKTLQDVLLDYHDVSWDEIVQYKERYPEFSKYFDIF